ncbi:MAG: MtrB/PioB family decaheme-associated outer membrane protein [Acidobacteria bacterium]|nr:MtrB/PioB family decaheme-associated outer membrane protein [Acidobacteriota bacterium]
MRTSITVLIAVTLIGAGAAAEAQPKMLPSRPVTPMVGAIDLGLRTTDISGDAARFQRFRDLGNGALVNRFTYGQERDGWVFEVTADHVGRLDQHYFGEYRSLGKVRASFEWDQTPLFYSTDTRTLYSTPSPGQFRLDDNTQRAIELKQLKVSDIAPGAALVETRSRRDTARFNLVYTPTRDLDVKLNVTSTKRNGTMPWTASLGFSNVIELAAPVDTRTTDIEAGAEWATPDARLSVGYTGSWFNNQVPTLVWDNPIKITDSTYASAYSPGDGTSQGRMSVWPSSTLHSVATSGSFKLPANSRVTGNISIGSWRQDEPLLPATINTAIAPIPLTRQTADAKARTLAMNYSFTSRPNPFVWLSAKYRYYDLDNQTPDFGHSPYEYVRLDQVWEEKHGGPEYYSYTRQNFDADVSLTPLKYTALKFGYGRGIADRTHRIFDRTTENVVRAAVDTTGNRFVLLRAIFERSTRTGSGFKEEALVEVAEQPAIRHFDVADRDRNRMTALIQVTPTPAVGLTASVATGKDDYKNSGFGLRDNENRVYSLGVDLLPGDTVTFGLSYGLETYSALQRSRTASPLPSPQFTDPTRDWSIDSDDRTHTVMANLDLLKLFPKTELRFAYDFNRSKATYVYGVPSNSSIAPPQQLPPVRNELQSGTADLRYFLTEKLAVGFTYWYDAYRVDDFALGPGTINRIDLPGSLFLGYVYRPYTANSGWVRLIYFW